MKSVGKPDAGNPHVRFDERGVETDDGQPALHRATPRLYWRPVAPMHLMRFSLKENRARGRCQQREAGIPGPVGMTRGDGWLRLELLAGWEAQKQVCRVLQN
jgi:hypothetical protein